MAVWTLPEVVWFLDGIKNDQLARVWWLTAFARAALLVRRAAFVEVTSTPTRMSLAVHRQLVALPGTLYYGPPRGGAGNPNVALDAECVARLQDQLARQAAIWTEHRYVAQARGDARAQVGAETRRCV